MTEDTALGQSGLWPQGRRLPRNGLSRSSMVPWSRPAEKPGLSLIGPRSNAKSL